MGVVAAEQSEHTIALAVSQSEAAAAVRESLVATFDSLAVGLYKLDSFSAIAPPGFNP
jgi:hypothetical protein